MSLTVEQLAEEAMALPANARAQLVDRLVESLARAGVAEQRGMLFAGAEVLQQVFYRLGLVAHGGERGC